MSKILVTGATGNVGKHVVSQLAEAGLDVRALARDPGRAARPVETVPAGTWPAGTWPAGTWPVEIVRGDLTAPESLEPALRDVESVFLLWPSFTADGADETITA